MYNFEPSYKISDLFNYVKAYGCSKKSKFTGTFEIDLHEKTLQKAKELGISNSVWPYYELEDDFYILNSYGYRTDEFDTYEDDKFDIVIGCSFTEGVGLRKQEMWVHHYEQRMNTRTVNLGKGGNSNKNIKNTLLSWYLSGRAKPKRVLLNWTEATRCTYVRVGHDGQEGTPVHLNYRWRIDKVIDEHDAVINELYETRLKSNPFWSNDFIEDLAVANALCKAWGVKVYNFPISISWTPDDIDNIYKYTDIKCYIIEYNLYEGWGRMGDKKFFPASDGSHFGPQHQLPIAEQMQKIILHEEN